MKKIVIISLILVVNLLVLTACGSDKNEAKTASSKHEDVFLEAKTDDFTEVSEMETAADCIVYGEKISEEKPTIENSEEDGGVVSAYTLSGFKIKSIESENAQGLKVGDVITIYENEAFYQEENVTLHIQGYIMMEMGNEYLLFLGASDADGWYFPLGVNLGKVPVDTEEETIIENQENQQDVNDYEELSEEVIDKYNDVPWE